MVEYGDSVYQPIGSIDKVSRKKSTGGGPLGRWVKLDDPDYEEVFKEQKKAEETWTHAREEAGDG